MYCKLSTRIIMKKHVYNEFEKKNKKDQEVSLQLFHDRTYVLSRSLLNQRINTTH